MVSDYLSSMPSIPGLFANEVLGKLDGIIVGRITMTTGAGGSGVNDNMLHRSSSEYNTSRFTARQNDHSTRQKQLKGVLQREKHYILGNISKERKRQRVSRMPTE